MLAEILNGSYLRRCVDCCELPARILEELAYSDDPEVRIAVADNRATPLDILWVLANDESPDVRYALAENHNIDHALLMLLTLDDNPYIARRAQRTLRRLGCPHNQVVPLAVLEKSKVQPLPAA